MLDERRLMLMTAFDVEDKTEDDAEPWIVKRLKDAGLDAGYYKAAISGAEKDEELRALGLHYEFILPVNASTMGMAPEEISDVICAIGNHDEATGLPINPIAAAIIIGDKTDVRSNRVRWPLLRENDIHDRVNGAVEKAVFTLDHDARTVTLSLTIDTEQCPVLEYFQIFLGRMQMCQRAAKYLKCRFRLVINEGLMLG